jgi:opine dehydrogenase
MNKFAVIGAGNAGSTVAAHLKLLGKEVSLYDVSEEQLKPIIENDNRLELTGNIDIKGEARIDLVTMDLALAITDAQLIICTTPAHVHKFVAKDLAALIQPEQIVMLNPGRTGGALEFKKILKENGQSDILVVESQTILYACRRQGTTVNVFGKKGEIPSAGLPRNQQDRFFDIIQTVFPEFVPVKGSIWTTSMNNIGMLFHPAPTLLNMGRMESGSQFDYYIDGMSPTIAEIVEQLDEERLEVAKALGVKTPTVLEWLKSNYNASGKNLYTALQNNNAYHGISAPSFSSSKDKLNLRYVIEDVPSGLVPVEELGKKFNLKTPCMTSIIDLANVMYNTDFRAKGRNLEQLGLQNMTEEEIQNL